MVRSAQRHEGNDDVGLQVSAGAAMQKVRRVPQWARKPVGATVE